GYMVVAFDGAADSLTNAEDVLDWLLATPEQPTAAGEHNPFWAQLDRERIGLAGHSRGGQAASVLGQLDPRVTAIVSWDRGSNLPLPERLDTPTLFFVADYDCQANPVCQPELYPEPPQGEGPNGRGGEYDFVRAAGVDAMKVALRATTHLDWVPSEPSGNRYGEIVSVYYTLAWFDRYLKGAENPQVAERGFARLTAERFDDSADRHNISQGLWDPAPAAQSPTDPYAGNVPYTIATLPVRDRLSFYFRSKCFLTPPGEPEQRIETTDMRGEGCG
ncbi:MAG: alpha/beta hydrolase family protein, partial [Solirubrobacterales bacterium]